MQFLSNYTRDRPVSHNPAIRASTGTADAEYTQPQCHCVVLPEADSGRCDAAMPVRAGSSSSTRRVRMKRPSRPVGSSGGKKRCCRIHEPSSRPDAPMLPLAGEAGSQSIASGSERGRVRRNTASSSSSSPRRPVGSNKSSMVVCG